GPGSTPRASSRSWRRRRRTTRCSIFAPRVRMRRQRSWRWSPWSSGISPMTETLRLCGRVAAPGLVAGPLARLADTLTSVRRAGPPEAERAALEQALARAATDLAALAASQASEAAAILEFQLALLEDEDLAAPAFAEIDAGLPADRAWRQALDAQTADYA